MLSQYLTTVMLDLAHSWLLSPWLFVAVLLAVMLLPLLAWSLATLLVGARARSGRASRAVGLGAWASVGLLVLARLAELALPSLSGGPQGWLVTWLGTPSDGWYPSDAVLFWMPLHGLAMVIGSLVAARWLRDQPAASWSLPHKSVAEIVLWLSPPLAMLFAWPQLVTRSALIPGLDVLAALPVLCTALAVWARSYDLEPETEDQVSEEATAAAPQHLDIPRAWQVAGAISTADRPWHAVRSEAEPGGHPVAIAAWNAAGGVGGPPVALDELAAEPDTPGHGKVIGDLPEPTASLLETAALLITVRDHGLRALVVGPDPRKRKQAFERALIRADSWSVGSLSAGTAELRDHLSRGELPAIAWVDIGELSSDVLALLMDGSGAGQRLCSALGLVILPRVDRGTPLLTTHRLFTLRRLYLALDSARAKPSLLALGFSGRGTRSLVQRAFPGFEVREVPLRPRCTSELSVWLADWRFQADVAEPWARRAARPVVEAGYGVAVTDPTGTFDEDDIAIWSGDVHLDRDVDLGGAASIGVLDDLWLLASVRALPNLVPSGQRGRHHTLWGLVDTPVTRFLVTDGNVHKLLAKGRLQPPVPLLGHDNRSLGRAHLKAALHDGAHPAHALKVAFGPSLVDEVAGSLTTERFEVRLDRSGAPVRSAVLPRARQTTSDPIRDTVADKTLEVVDRESGRLLGRVDALTAPTRFYPKRVFAVRGERFEVPMHGLDARRERLEVTPVPPERPLTRPQLRVFAKVREVTEAPQQVVSGSQRFRLGTFSVIANEKVSGIRRGKEDSVTYPEVRCRYRTRARGIFFEQAAERATLYHLARSFDGVLQTFLLAADDDIDVVPVSSGWAEGHPAGVLAVDRHVQGMGAAAALDEHVVRDALDLVYAILNGCKCTRGCPQCTPAEVLEDGAPDKPGVLALLGG